LTMPTPTSASSTTSIESELSWVSKPNRTLNVRPSPDIPGMVFFRPVMRSHHMPSIRPILALALFASIMAGCGEPSATTDPGTDAGLSFVDATSTSGLDTFEHENGHNGLKWYAEQMGSGGGFIDFDSDGDLDIILLGGGDWDPTTDVKAVWAYRNDGSGSFTEVADTIGFGEVSSYTIGLSAADYDADGDTDVFITTLTQNLLFRNDSGNFTDVSDSSGLSDTSIWSSSAAFFDADNDGDLLQTTRAFSHNFT